MSTDDSSSDTDSESDEPAPYRGTRISGEHQRVNAMQNQAMFSQMLTGRNGTGTPTRLNNNPLMRTNRHGGDRISLGMSSEAEQPTVWSAVNYPHESEFQFESYYIRYIRQPEAKAVIDKPVNDTWQDDPIIHDAKYADEDEPQSEFEKKVKEFMEGEATRRKPTHRLAVLDKMARLGHYGVMVIGFADGRDMETPVAGIDADNSLDPDDLIEYEAREGVNVPDSPDEPEFDDLDDVMYLAVFGEDRVVDIDTNSDMTSPRYRLPEFYELITEEKEPHERESQFDAETIHWTRTIHVPEGTLEDDLRGIPALKPVFHELLNIDKIKAASGEGFWRAGYQGLQIRPPKDQQGKFMEFENDGDDVKKEIRDFLNNFDRTLATTADIQSIESEVGDPVPHLDANYQSISMATDIPQSVLTGKDRADTADNSDLNKYERKIASRRNNYATPAIIKPLIQRLIDTGVLPEPEGDGFVVEWPPLEELTDLQKWELRNKIASSIKNISPGGDTSMFATVPELRQAIGWNPNMGSMVDEDKLDAPQEEQTPDRDPVGQGGRPGESEAEQQAGSTENQLAVDEDALPSSSMSEFEFPDETYERPKDAEQRANALGMEPTYHVQLLDGDVFYVPGDDLDQLRNHLNGEQSEKPARETIGVESDD